MIELASSNIPVVTSQDLHAYALSLDALTMEQLLREIAKSTIIAHRVKSDPFLPYYRKAELDAFERRSIQDKAKAITT